MSMSSRKTLSLVCPMACAAGLAVGYAIVAQWIALAVILLTSLAWLLAAHKWPAAEWVSMALVVFVGLAAAGLFAGVSPSLMIFSATLALASWDLALFDQVVTDLSSTSPETITLFENRHYQSLILALGLGLLIAVAGRMIHFEIPLGGMIFLVILALLGLDRVWRALIV